MKVYTTDIKAQRGGKVYREEITFTDLDKDGNKIIVELSTGYRGSGEYIAVDVQRLGSNGIYAAAFELNPQVKEVERRISGVECINYIIVPAWVLEPTAANKRKILCEIAKRAFCK